MELRDQAAWERWLAENHDTSAGVWLKLAKKRSPTEKRSPTAGDSPSAHLSQRPRTPLTYSEAVDSALCQGWIDGQKAAHDESYWLQRFTPRRPRSKWSQINRERVMRLIAEQRMQPAGLAEVEAAKLDGRWEAAYAPQSRAKVPEDFQEALDRTPAAKAFFATISSANRYAVLYRINDAKRPETRARRIDEYTAMLAEHRTLH